jgi:hypothetical protein
MNRAGQAAWFLVSVFAGAGCAPRQFAPAVLYYVDAHGVRDGAAVRAKGFWYLRFRQLTVSDLDDAIQAGRAGNHEQMRTKAALVLRAANSLAQSCGSAEIDRLPGWAQIELARRAGVPSTAEQLKQAYRQQAQIALESLLKESSSWSPDQFKRWLVSLRRSIEPAPDDQGRVVRQLALAWGAAPAWLGVAVADKRLEERRRHTANETFEQAVAWLPRPDGRHDLLARFAPMVLIHEPAKRSYSADDDRLGEVYLTGRPTDIDVRINTSRPMMYAYADEAKIHGRRYPQLVYTWWYPARPPMETSDPAAGHIDGDTLRITLDAQNRPIVFEVMQSCGCGHLVYVSEGLEAQARRQFGEPSAGHKWAVQTDQTGKRDLIVMGTVKVPSTEPRPVAFVEAGYHSVLQIDCRSGFATEGLNVVRAHEYDLAEYDQLERLPLGNGVASMFGPDGLVHKAGRQEGLLLAPTGILSAGQPRKRGTQKIRWDEYSFDDPRLLEKTLRLPEGF